MGSQEKQGVAAPASDGMARNESGAFGGDHRRLNGSQNEALGLRADFGGRNVGASIGSE